MNSEPVRRSRGSIIALGFGMVAIMNAFLAFSLWKDYDNRVEAAFQETQNLSRTFEKLAMQSVAGLDQILLELQEISMMEDDDLRPVMLESELKRRILGSPVVMDILVLDVNGGIVHWTGNGTPPIVRDRPYFQVQKSAPYRGLFIGPPSLSRVHDGKWFFSLSRRLQDSHGNFSGVAVVIVDLMHFRSAYSELVSGSGVSGTLIGEHGRAYFSVPDGAGSPGEIAATGPLDTGLSAFRRERNGIEESPVGTREILSQRMVPNFPLFVRVTRPVEDVVQQWQEQLPVPLVASGAVSVLLLLLSSALQRQARLREQTVNALSESKKALEYQYSLHRNFLNALPLPAFVIDVEGRLQGANRRFAGFVGKPLSEIVSMPLSRLVGKDALRTFIDHDATLLTRGGEFSYEATTRNANGEEREILFHKAGFETDGGKIGGLVCAMLDQTEQKQALQDLIRAETRLTEAIESNSDGFALFDPEDRLVLCNNNFRLAFDLIANAVRPGVTYRDLIQALAEFRLYDFEGMSRQAWIEARMALHREADGREHRYCLNRKWYSEREYRTQEGGILMIRSDITSAKEAEDALKTSEQRFRDVADAAGEYIWETDRDFNIVFITDRIRSIIGYSPDEILGRPVFEFMDNEEALRVRDFVRATSARQAAFQARDFVLKHRNGTSVWQRGSGIPIVDHNEALVGYRGVSADISSQRQAEDELRSARDSAEASLVELQAAQERLLRSEKMASLGSLVAGIAHEVNTPVGTALTSATHLAGETRNLRRMYEEETLSPQDLEEFMAGAEEASRLLTSNCQRAAELIQSFKQVAVDQTGGERRSIILKDYFHEILLSLRPRLKKTKLETIVECHPPSLVLDSYPGALSQILTNLIMNSILHAFEPGAEGRISILARQQEGDKIAIEYRDNGRGIPARNMKKIFDPFFTTKRGLGGSGLGLNILFNLVEKNLLGEVHAESEEGKGVLFTIVIPASLPEDL